MSQAATLRSLLPRLGLCPRCGLRTDSVPVAREAGRGLWIAAVGDVHGLVANKLAEVLQFSVRGVVAFFALWHAVPAGLCFCASGLPLPVESVGGV